MKIDHNIKIYYSFKEFIENYDNDFNNWLLAYPDGNEEYFLNSIKNRYKKEKEYYQDAKGVFSDVITLLNYDNIEEYPNVIDVYLRDFAYLLEKRVSHLLEKTYSEVENNYYYADCILKSFEVSERLPTDLYFIEDQTLQKHLPFLDVVEIENRGFYDGSDYDWKVQYNEFKYKNFEYSLLRIFDFIDNKLQNTGFAKSNIEWKGTQTELTELIKALIENGSLKGTQKDIFKSFCEFLNFEINNHDKLIQDIRKRNNDNETIFLNKLKSSLLNFINQ